MGPNEAMFRPLVEFKTPADCKEAIEACTQLLESHSMAMTGDDQMACQRRREIRSRRARLKEWRKALTA